LAFILRRIAPSAASAAPISPSGEQSTAGRRGRARQPVVTFFLVSVVVTPLGYAGWGAQNHWTLPEFSTVGLFS
jgi:hypothetical protein